MPTTPTYALPYQSLTVAPNGPTLGQDLAEAVETELARIDADNAAQDALIAAPDAAWTTWTPGWTASAGSPAIGNGTLTGRYRRQGKTYDLAIFLLGGSTSNYGTAGAYWIFDISGMAGFVATPASVLFGGLVSGLDVTVIEYSGMCRVYGAGTQIELFKPVSGRWTNTSPWTFGTGDYIGINLRLEST